MSRYSCSLRGNCSEDPFGDYDSLEDCQGECRSLDSHERESVFVSLSYAPEQALALSSTDRVEYIRREYGLITTPEDSSDLLIALLAENHLYLFRNGYIDYLRKNLKVNTLGFLVLEIYSLSSNSYMQYHWIIYSLMSVINGISGNLTPGNIVRSLFVNNQFTLLIGVSRDQVLELLTRNWDIFTELIPDPNRGYIRERYTCNLVGQCEIDIKGVDTLEVCRARCKIVLQPEERDKYLLALSLEEAKWLVSSDTDRYLTLHYGVVDFPRSSIGAIVSLLERNYVALMQYYPQITDPILDDFDYLLMKIPNKFLSSKNWDLIRLTYHRYLLRASRTDPDFMANIQQHLNIYSNPPSLIPLTEEELELLRQRYG